MRNNVNSHSESNCTTLQLLERRLEHIENAFPRTDIGTIDIDGHREYHTDKKRDKVLQREYLEGVTKRLLLGGVSLACTALGAGFADWGRVADFVKGVLVP